MKKSNQLALFGGGKDEKFCKPCQKNHPLNYFLLLTNGNYDCWCKEARKKRRHDHYLKNKKKEISQIFEYRKKNPGKANEWSRNWHRNNPGKAKKISKKYYDHNRDILIAKKQKWNQENPDKILISRIKRDYNLTKEQYDNMMDHCCICGSKENLNIDHDHETGLVRDRLCRNCNFGLGAFKDNPDYLYVAVQYLMKHGKEKPMLRIVG